MRIGIIGSGNMGRALGVRWAAAGHEVAFGARNAAQAQAAAELAGHGALAGGNDEAAAFAQVAVWTMRETRAGEVLTRTEALAGKPVIDLNNRDMPSVREGSWPERSIAEALQEALPAARVVKAFNTIPMETFDIGVDALRDAGAQTLIAGDDPDAKRAVTRLADDLGFEAVDMGGIIRARACEAMGDAIRLLIIDAGLGGRAHLHVTMLPAPDLGVIGARQATAYL